MSYKDGIIYLDKDELNNYSIIDIYNDDDDVEIHTNIANDTECCVNCFFSDGQYCSLKGVLINQHSPLCWFYRDCLTIRASDDFKDDCDIF